MSAQPAIADTVLYADDSPDVFARAGAARDSFGFPIGASRTGRHVHDGLRKADYDEVTEVDSAGRPISRDPVRRRRASRGGRSLRYSARALGQGHRRPGRKSGSARPDVNPA